MLDIFTREKQDVGYLYKEKNKMLDIFTRKKQDAGDI